MGSIVHIEFGKSKSAKYKKALDIIRKLPNYAEIDDINSCSINSVKEYITFQDDIRSLIDMVTKWKDTVIYLYDKKYESSYDLYDFNDKLKENAGKYAIFLENRKDGGVSLGSVTMEDLPLPIVFYPSHYGAFFAFADDIDSDFFFCECEKEAIQNYILLRNQKPLENYVGPKTYPLGSDAFPPYVAEISREWQGELATHIQYKAKICFKCNNKIPKKKYCHPMYGGQFVQHYGWYIRQEYFKLGIDKYQLHKMNVLPSECTPELYDNIKRISELFRILKDRPDVYDEVEKLKKELDHAVENSVREEFGYKKIGDAWVSETMLFQIIKGIYPEEDIIRHYRPRWLKGLELDIFIPDINLAFEYQGIQHFEPIEHWGGIEKLKIQQEHDAKKKKICTELGIRLICINYDEELTEEHIRARI